MNTHLPLDDRLCPLCQQENHCQLDKASSCWCMQAEIPEQLTAKVPEQLKGKVCICQNCQRTFIAKHK